MCYSGIIIRKCVLKDLHKIQDQQNIFLHKHEAEYLQTNFHHTYQHTSLRSFENTNHQDMQSRIFLQCYQRKSRLHNLIHMTGSYYRHNSQDHLDTFLHKSLYIYQNMSLVLQDISRRRSKQNYLQKFLRGLMGIRQYMFSNNYRPMCHFGIMDCIYLMSKQQIERELRDMFLHIVALKSLYIFMSIKDIGLPRSTFQSYFQHNIISLQGIL